MSMWLALCYLIIAIFMRRAWNDARCVVCNRKTIASQGKVKVNVVCIVRVVVRGMQNEWLVQTTMVKELTRVLPGPTFIAERHAVLRLKSYISEC